MVQTDSRRREKRGDKFSPVVTTPTRVLVSQATIVIAIIVAGLWLATACTAAFRCDTAQGASWFSVLCEPAYPP